MNDNPSRGRSVDITLHQVFIEDVRHEHDDDDLTRVPGLDSLTSPNDLTVRTSTYTVTINGAVISGVRAFHVQLHDPNLTGPDDPDPRTTVLEHWGRDPELIIGAWHSDRSALQNLAKHHEERANELAADLDHAERDNRRLQAELERLRKTT